MRLLDILLAISVAALWGGNFVAAKFGVTQFPPFFLTALRFVATAMLLVPLTVRPNRRQLLGIMQLALVLGTLHLALLFSAMYHGLDIASCAIIAQLGVPFSCLLGVVFFKDRLGKWRQLGMVVAFCGMMIVAGTPNVMQHMAGFAIALAAAFCWGLANIIIKRIEGVGTFALLGWMALFSVPPLLLISGALESGQGAALAHAPWRAWLALAYTVLCSTIMGYGLWYHLLHRYDVSQVAPFSLLTPVFGIAIGQLFFSEALTWQVLLGGAITIAGVTVLVVRRPRLAELGERV